MKRSCPDMDKPETKSCRFVEEIVIKYLKGD